MDSYRYYSIMSWLADFYIRRKNPWIGFILVFLLGPFGFLYNSWKTALGVLFVVGPLWLTFLRHTRFDLIENPWAHYVALFLLAGFAWLQIKAHQIERSKEVNDQVDAAPTLESTIMLLPDHTTRKAFAEYLGKHPALAQGLRTKTNVPPDCENLFKRIHIATTLTDYAGIQGNAGDLSGASSSLLYSIQFLDENPIAWAGMAEVYMRWEDKVAVRWARKAYNFNPQRVASEELRKIYSETASLAMLQELKAHMQSIIKVCSEHPEWRDS